MVAEEQENFRQNFNNISLSAFELRQSVGFQRCVIGLVRSSPAIKTVSRIRGEDQDLLMLWASTQMLTSLCFAHRIWHQSWVREELLRQWHGAVACAE